MFTQDISSSPRTMLPYSPRAWSSPEICSSPWPWSIAFNENTWSSLIIVLDLEHNLYELSSNNLASSFTLACVCCLLSLQFVGMEKVDQIANQVSGEHENSQQMSVLMRIPFSYINDHLSRVKPWPLWMVIAQWKLETWAPGTSSSPRSPDGSDWKCHQQELDQCVKINCH